MDVVAAHGAWAIGTSTNDAREIRGGGVDVGRWHAENPHVVRISNSATCQDPQIHQRPASGYDGRPLRSL